MSQTPNEDGLSEAQHPSIQDHTPSPLGVETTPLPSSPAPLLTEKMPDLVLKPNYLSYIFLGDAQFFGLCGVTFLLFVGCLFSIWMIVYAIPLLFVSCIQFLFRHIAYSKEKYTIKATTIVYQYGGIFSDNTIEIHISKITQVIAHLGFIEQKIFKTGALALKTAGSSQSKIIFRALANPLDLYQEIQTRMQHNGFRLKKEHLIQTQKPHLIGVIGESFRGMLVNILWFLYFGYILITSPTDPSSPELSNTEPITQSDLMVGIVIIGIIFAIVVIKFILRYFDIKKRVYEVYEDSVFFSEGFLSKNYSFLPMESIADAENNQSFFSKIFGIHDVVVSSEGSNNRVYFFNMVNGKKMMETIKYLKKQFAFQAPSEDDTKVDSSPNKTLQAKTHIDFNRQFTAQFQPDLKKTCFDNLFYIIPVFTIPILIIKLIKAKFSKYLVMDTTFEYQYQFLSSKHYSYSIDKVTLIVFHESIFDRWFHTCSFDIYSIGSPVPLRFENIKKEDLILQNMLSKIGIYEETPSEKLKIHFGFGEWIKANIGVCVFVGIFLLSIGSLILTNPYKVEESFDENLLNWVLGGFILVWIIGILLAFLYKKIFYSPTYYEHKIHSEFVSSQTGIIFKTLKYVHRSHIKSLESKKYPMTTVGTLALEVSGDSQIQYGQKANQVRIISLGIKIPFTLGCNELIESLEEKIYGHPLESKELASRKQDLANTLLFWPFVLYFVSVFVNPIPQGKYLTLVFGLLSLIGIIVYVKSKSYQIQEERILASRGIVYKSRKSIPCEKLNFVEQNQGFIHKIFGNGNVLLFTKGSGNADLKILNVSKHTEVYVIIKEKIDEKDR